MAQGDIASQKSIEGSVLETNFKQQEQNSQDKIKHKIQCKDCGLLFAKSYNLKIHHDTIHKKLKPFRCQECGKWFGRKDHLVKHIKIHAKQRNKKCQVCGKCFSLNSDLIEHNKVVHNIKFEPSYTDKADTKGDCDSLHNEVTYTCEDDTLPTFITLNQEKISDE